MIGKKPTTLFHAKVAEALKYGWFRAFLPPELGGICHSMAEALYILKRAALQDGSLGWAVNLGSGTSWFYPYVDKRMAETCWGNPEAIVAGSGEKGHLEAALNGQWYLSGYWPRCTAAPWASWFTLNAQTAEGQNWTCLVPAKELQLQTNTWQQFGLQHSGTFAVEAAKIKLQSNQVFSLDKPNWTTGHFTELWSFPNFARVCMSASFLGLFEGLYEQFLKELGKSSHHMSIKRQLQNWEYQLFNEIDQGDAAMKALVKWHQKAIDISLILYREAGMRMGQVGHPLHLSWSDFMTAAHHPYLW